MKCKHYKGDGWSYVINDTEKIYLCDKCSINLIMNINVDGGKREFVKEEE